MDQLASLTPEQRQQVMQQAAMQANQQIMQDMMSRSVQQCFKRCVGVSVRLTVHSILAQYHQCYYRGIIPLT